MVEEPLRTLNAKRKRHLQGRRIEVFDEQAPEVARPYPEPIGEGVDTPAIERTLFDQRKRAFDSRPGSLPCRAERSGFRAAAQTGPKTRAFCGRRATIEFHVFRKRRSRRADRTAIDPRRLHRHKHDSVPRRIASSESLVLCREIEHPVDITAVVAGGEFLSRTKSENDRCLRFQVATAGKCRPRSKPARP